MTPEQPTDLDRALRLLGPLEARIMRDVWTAALPQPFVVRDMQSRMPELAYTTVMTTLNRLADKRLLDVQAVDGQRAHAYGVAIDPPGYLARAGREQVQQVVEQFGDAAIAAFAEHLDRLSPEQLRRLEEVGQSCRQTASWPPPARQPARV